MMRFSNAGLWLPMALAATSLIFSGCSENSPEDYIEPPFEDDGIILSRISQCLSVSCQAFLLVCVVLLCHIKYYCSQIYEHI